MNLFAAITLPEYCERFSDSFLGEPMNLFTNILFILSGIIAWLYIDKKSLSLKTYLKTLTVLIGLIGIGSFLFHGVPNEFTILLDAIPIYTFIALALALVFYQLTNSWWFATVLVGILAGILISISILIPPDFLNGSIRHILILAMATILIGFVYRKYDNISIYLVPVVGVYTLAIAARSVDQDACAIIPFGTHFMWHILNALASYLAIVFLVKLIQENAPKF